MINLELLKKLNFINVMRSIYIALLFLIATIVMVHPLLETQRILATSDWSFHASRVEQIYDNLRQGKMFTFVATTTFQHTGAGSFLFYPTLFIYPWAILRFYFNPITSFYIWYGIVTFFTYAISYLCMFSFSKSRIRSIIFSFIYVLAPYRLYLGGFVFGEFTAVTFIPIAFLGFYEIVCRDSKRWYVLSIGMSLLILSHVLSVLLTVEVFTFLFIILIFTRRLTFLQIKAFAFSAILTLVLSLPVLVSFATDFIGHNIYSAYKGIGILIDGNTMIQDSLSNTAGSDIGLLLLATVFVGWAKTKKGTIERYSYWMGLLLIIISTSIFPWEMISKSFLGTVQLPWRYLSYAILFLGIIASNIILAIYNSWNTKGSFVWFSLLIAIIGMYSYFGSISGTVEKIKNYDESMVLKPAVQGNIVKEIPQPVQLNVKNYKYQFGYKAAYGETDYYTKKAQDNSAYTESIINNTIIINSKKSKAVPIAGPNYLTFNLSLDRESKVDLPVVVYEHTYVYINHKKVSFSQSKRGTVQLKIDKGKNVVTVGYAPSKLYFYALFISLGSWFTLAATLIFKKMKFNTAKKDSGL